MTSRDFIALAEIVGTALALARTLGGEEAYKLAYDSVYTAAVHHCSSVNPKFDQVRFSYAVAQAIEGSKFSN
jgi:hypothetical protein